MKVLFSGPSTITNVMDMTGVKSKAYRRTRELCQEFGCEDITLEFTEQGIPLQGSFNKAIKEKIREKETAD